ncbi:MAG: hypothetical protein L0Y38_03890 [Methylococcaceae bacterium]|nr:hypothetical protein [Methylococcaceae bacterium]MCI0732950.1 hypothetical protein [Methylococcaceae bacterium]
MVKKDPEIVPRVGSVRRESRIEEGVLILLIILSLIGVGVTDFSPTDGYWYWIFMILIFGLISIGLAFVESKKMSGTVVKEVLAVQAIHWLGSMLTVFGVFLLLQAGRLNYEDTGLVILLILALATFIDGIHLGWRFSVAGLFLGTTSVIAAFFDDFMWIVLVLAIVIILLTLYWEQRGSRAA